MPWAREGDRATPFAGHIHRIEDSLKVTGKLPDAVLGACSSLTLRVASHLRNLQASVYGPDRGIDWGSVNIHLAWETELKVAADCLNTLRNGHKLLITGWLLRR